MVRGRRSTSLLFGVCLDISGAGWIPVRSEPYKNTNPTVDSVFLSLPSFLSNNHEVRSPSCPLRPLTPMLKSSSKNIFWIPSPRGLLPIAGVAGIIDFGSGV